MKKLKKHFNRLLFLALLFCSGYWAIGQSGLNFTLGAGLPELLHAGLRYQTGDVQLGLSYGFVPVSDESVMAISGDVFYHFGGTSAYSERPPWYARVGLVYLRDETERVIDKYTYLNLRAGRDMNLSPRLGTAIGLGIIIELAYEEVRKQPSGGWFNIDIEAPVLPSLGIALFYRL